MYGAHVACPTDECRMETQKTSKQPPQTRLHIIIQGAVQGVGFRPFIYRLATEMQLIGWVNNSSQGVFIEVEGNQKTLQEFLLKIEKQKPPLAIIQSLETTWLDTIGYTKFEIKPSITGQKTALVLPDIATCPDCLKDIFDPKNRRYHYPFTNCTNCGPRYTIIEQLPYDRSNTTMQKFTLCSECQQEYENPLDRRFHAQPNACPNCGPQLQLLDNTGTTIETKNQAIYNTIQALKQGKIIAIKGLGGFHLIVDASNPTAINELRRRKKRSEKPFALMYPSLEKIKQDCHISPSEERLLTSPQSPIVLLKHKNKPTHPNSILKNLNTIAPGNPYLGIMLPYTPLHHLLMAEFNQPVIATSGNLSDEPICIDEQQALTKLSEIADLFLIHNRPILRPVDDSIVRIIAGREMILRRARGYAPLPISLPTSENSNQSPISHPILATGAHLKNTIALAIKNQIFISQHIGDLETPEAFNSFQQIIENFKQLYEVQPEIVACDAHPDYLSTKYAQNLLRAASPTSILPTDKVYKPAPTSLFSIQHHHAHILACLAENQLLGKSALGIAWDGTGYGLDNTIWGGEFFQILPIQKTENTNNLKIQISRIAHFRQFPLAGGDKAIKEPRRTALGLLYEIFGKNIFTNPPENLNFHTLKAFTPQELKILQTMYQQHINTPLTSSVGRLFDSIASLTNQRQILNFEGQSAMELEFAIEDIENNQTYPFKLTPNPSSPLIIDWQPTILAILNDIHQQIPLATISVKFHNTLVETIIAVAKYIKEQKIILSGGCFQNKYLLEKTIRRLQQENLQPYWHQRIPPNDGGIALGQIIATLFPHP